MHAVFALHTTTLLPASWRRFWLLAAVLWLLGPVGGGGLPSAALTAQVVHRSGREVDAHAYHAEIDTRGDTLAVIQLHSVYCYTCKHFRNTRHEREYWRMVNDVKKTLPIAKAARRLMVQAYDTIQHIPTEKAQRAHFKMLEKELMAEYKPRLKRLNYRQGKLLVRLVDRECDKQTYQLIREFLGARKAFFWNMFGRMFGVSLKAEWDPEGKDRELEDVCIQVEQGNI